MGKYDMILCGFFGHPQCPPLRGAHASGYHGGAAARRGPANFNNKE